MRSHRIILLVAIVIALGHVWLRGGFDSIGGSSASTFEITPAFNTVVIAAGQTAAGKRAVATFAAGCFWCTESDFEKVPGVISVTSGYTGGRVANPTYEQVSRGGTGHAESVEIVYDPSKVSYEQLLDHFWHNVDPFVAHRQFCDVGTQYRPEIFVHDEAQKAAAEASKARVQQRFKQPILVDITQAGPFYRAEEYHQDYYKKNPIRYQYYRWGCGRDRRLAEIWGTSQSE
jgi:peptide-methionine (S)-S-oxide reductase